MLLHHGTGSVSLWRDFPHALNEATGRRVVAYSRYGHGSSDPAPHARTPGFMHEEALTVLPELLTALGSKREPILVGHSDGASIALIHAAHHATPGVVAIAPHVFVEDITVAGIREARRAYETTDLKARMAKHHADPDAAFYGWANVWASEEFRSWDLTSELSGIESPVLLIQGTSDEYGTLAHVDAIEKAATGPTQRVLLDCGHQPHLERPEETLEAVSNFVTELTPAGTCARPAGRTRR